MLYFCPRCCQSICEDFEIEQTHHGVHDCLSQTTPSTKSSWTVISDRIRQEDILSTLTVVIHATAMVACVENWSMTAWKRMHAGRSTSSENVAKIRSHCKPRWRRKQKQIAVDFIRARIMIYRRSWGQSRRTKEGERSIGFLLLWKFSKLFGRRSFFNILVWNDFFVIVIWNFKTISQRYNFRLKYCRIIELICNFFYASQYLQELRAERWLTSNCFNSAQKPYGRPTVTWISEIYMLNKHTWIPFLWRYLETSKQHAQKICSCCKNTDTTRTR